MQTRCWWESTRRQCHIAYKALGWWENCNMLEVFSTISYSSLYPFYIFIEILPVHWEQEMWAEGLQWVWAGSSEVSFHKSLQPGVIGFHIPPRITTHFLFVFIYKKIKTFALAPLITLSVKTDTVSTCLVFFPHIWWNNKQVSGYFSSYWTHPKVFSLFLCVRIDGRLQ